MRLEGNLYRITAREADGRYVLQLLPDCIIYKAHFPGMPVTPGVCIVQMVKELAERECGARLDITTVRNVKFLSVLTPWATPGVIFAKMQTDGGTVSFQAKVLSDTEVFANVSLVCDKR